MGGERRLLTVPRSRAASVPAVRGERARGAVRCPVPPGLQALRCRCSARTAEEGGQTDRRGAARISAAAEAASRHSRFGARHPELCPPTGRENGSGCRSRGWASPPAPGKSSLLPGGSGITPAAGKVAPSWSRRALRFASRIRFSLSLSLPGELGCSAGPARPTRR